MRSMKTLLKLMGAVTLSTVAASSVVACGIAKAPVLNGKYAVLLGWYSDETTSKIKQKLSKNETITDQEKEEITIDNKQDITNTNFKAMLLIAGSGADAAKFKAKNDDAAKFLADLGFKSGNDNKYYSSADIDAITALKAEITSSKAGKIEVNSGKNDFNVAAGTCQISIIDKAGSDVKSIKDYTIDTLKKDNIGVPAEVTSFVIKGNLNFSKEEGYKKEEKVLKALPWITGKDKEKRLYNSLINLIGNQELVWSASDGGAPISNYPSSGKTYLMVKSGDVNLLTAWLDCGNLPN